MPSSNPLKKVQKYIGEKLLHTEIKVKNSIFLPLFRS
jgi:hypothetical protein